MSPDLDHVLLTRFNLPSPGAESRVRARDGWLRGRVELFERYCLPSVRAQTARVRWIVYFDPESPRWLLDWIARHLREGVFVPHFRASVSRVDLVADLRALVPRPAAGLITSNLDNDDAIATDFSARLRSLGPQRQRAAAYLAHGLILGGDRLYRRTDRSNAFCSVIESWDDPVGCWHDWHTRLGRSMPVREFAGDPGWLQVVHDSNVSNRIRGVLTSPGPYARLFPGLLDAVAPVTPGAIAADRMLRTPARGLRDAARGAAKGAILAVGGKRGLDRVKAALAREGS